MPVEVSFGPEAEKVDELKADLISQAVFLDRFSDCTRCPFERTIAHLTRQIGGNVADRGIVEITASSVRDEPHIPKYVADRTRVEHSFGSKSDGNQNS
jgi:hypothetical protein